jgi:hypothetical protein
MGAYGSRAGAFLKHLMAAETVKSTMNAHRAQDVTELLRAWSDGDQRALDGLTPIVYGELRRLAHRYMKRERPDHSLQATALSYVFLHSL